MTGSIGTTTTGGIFIGGTASKLDTAALIEAAVAQKTARATKLQVQVDKNTAKIGAYSNLQSLTDSLESSLDRLRGPKSLFDDTERVWDLRAGTVSTSDGSDYANIVDIAITSEAEIGDYQIEVTQKALAQKVSGNSVADKDAALGYAGSFDLGLLGGGSANISITAGQSLSDVADAINAETDNTGVKASVLKVGENEYQLVLSAQETAKDMTTFSTSGQDVLNLLGISDGFGGFQNTLQVAQAAIIEFDGVTITRDDNVFDDLVAGIELNINNAAPGTIINLEVGNDVESVKNAILDFVDAYNAIRDFVVQNQQVSADGVVADDAVLFSDALLDGVASILTDTVGQSFNSGGIIETIRDLGIELGNNNKLEIIDETKLDTAILNNFDAVKIAFAAGAETDNTEFRLTGNTATAASANIVFNLTTDGAGTITSVTANGNASAFTISGNTITGATGSGFEGLSFTYVGTAASVTINADFTQGLSEKILNGINGYTDSVTGLIQKEKATLQTDSQKKLEDASEILTKAEAFKQAQIDKYAKFEARLKYLEVLKSQISAILGNDNYRNNN